MDTDTDDLLYNTTCYRLNYTSSTITNGSGSGYGSGNGSGYGSVSGNGYGSVSGNGSGNGSGYGSAFIICCLDNVNLFDNCSSGDITAAPPRYPILRQSPAVMVVLSVMYSVTFVSALLGNVAIVSMVIKDRRFHSATYILIMNLAVADLIMTLACHPVNLVTSLFNGWLFGAFMCKAVPFLQGVAVCASVNTLVVIAVDRYIAICHVMRPRNTKCITRIILLVIWVLAFSLMTPWALFYRLDPLPKQDMEICYENFPEPGQNKVFFLGVIFLTCYALPLLFIVVCYVLIGYRVWHRDAPGITSSRGVIEKSKIRVVKMLVVVVLLFTFSWMPLYITRLKMLFFPPTLEEQRILLFVVPFAQWLGTSNSCMNPLVYCLFSQKIRRRIKAMVCCTKKELRTLYSNRSMYSSVGQNVRRESGIIRNDAPSCGNNGSMVTYLHHQQHFAAGSIYDQRNHVKVRGSQNQNELKGSFAPTRNGVRSTHV